MSASAVNLFPVTISGAHTLRIALDAPSRGEIRKALVVQISGTKEGFEYTFYDSAIGCPPGTDNDGSVTVQQEAQSQIIATRVVAAAGDRYVTGTPAQDANFGFLGVYANADGGNSGAQRKLYIKLKSIGAGTNKQYGIFLIIEPSKS